MITLCMIARNSEESIRRALMSVKADNYVVVLAGHSDDETESIVRDVFAMRSIMHTHTGVSHVIESFMPEDHPAAFFEDGALADFAAARNFALSFVPEGSHWLYIDADDEFIGDLQPAIDELEKGAGVVALEYEYAHNQYGKKTAFQNKERVFSGRITDWTWTDRVHEWCKTEQDAPYALLPESVVYHHRDPDPSRSARNERILNVMLAEDPNNRRAAFHLADCYFAQERWAEALDAYARFYQQYSTPEAEPFVYYAVCQASKAASALEDSNAAAYWAMLAVDMRPAFKDGYLLRAGVAADQQQWETTLIWLDQSTDKYENTNQTAVSVWADDYKWNLWNVQYNALFQLKRFKEAIDVATLALREYPESMSWQRDLAIAEEANRIERSVLALGHLVDHFVRRGDTLNAWEMIQDQRLPMTIRQDERVLALRLILAEKVKHLWGAMDYRAFYTSEVLGHEINGTSIDKYRLEPILRSLDGRRARRVLEVGTGAGGPAIWLLRQLPDITEYVGLDINPDLVEQANAAAKFYGLDDRLKFECDDLPGYMSKHPDYLGSMGMMNGPQPHFDACLLLELVEHMAPQDALNYVAWAEEIADAVLVTTPAMFCSDIPPLAGPLADYPRDHVKEWSLSDLEQMVYKVPRRRPVNIYKAYAPDGETELRWIYPDHEDVKTDFIYPYPGFANWFAEFDNRSRHNGPVTIYTGPGPGWSPLDFDTKGMGGAETMAMKMAEQFAKNDHPVCIYGDWTGVYNGVIYRHWSSFSGEKPYLGVDTWLFISSRMPAVFDEHINADIKWLWVHDVDVGALEFSEDRMEQVDRILVLSEWHKKHWLETYPWSEDRVVVTRNAIEPADFPNLLHLNGETGKLQRQRHKFVWPSSADRGLDLVLDWWPQIREMWDDAELHIFYGWDTANAIAHPEVRARIEFFKNKMKEMSDQPGVIWRGRVVQTELHKEMATSQFWLYPSKAGLASFDLPWNETYCIAAVEAMAMGVHPIVADTGALPERLREFGLADGLLPWGAPRKAWLKALKAHDTMPSQNELARRWDVAQELNFDNLYKEWLRLLMETSLADNADGKHNFSVVSQTV